MSDPDKLSMLLDVHCTHHTELVQVRIANESDFERHVFDRWSGDEAEEEEEEEVVASQRGRLGAVSSPTLRR